MRLAIRVLLNLFSIVHVGSYLPNLDLPRILQALNRTCVVVVIDSGLEYGTDESYSDVLMALKEGAFRDDDVLFGKSTYSELISDPHVKIKTTPALKIDQKPAIMVLERKLPDRSCLLADKLIFKELKASLYKGKPDLDSVLHFVNENCGTFKMANGRVNEKGQNRERILKNLYSVEKGPNMKTILDKCARDGTLKEFFYTGHCDGDQKITLPKCDVVDGSKMTKETFFADYISRSKPVILKNVLKTVWPNYQEWTNEFFRRNFGDRGVHIKLTPTGEFEGVEDADLWKNCPESTQDRVCVSPLDEIPEEVRKHLTFSKNLVMVRPASADMKMEEFIDLIENGTKWKGYAGNLSAYLEYTPVGENFVGFDEELPELPLVKDLLKLDLLNMWLSNGNTLGKLHFDQYDNFLCQISGKKRIILFEPHNNSRLYEGHIVEAKLAFQNGRFVRHGLMENTALTMSPVDIVKPNFKSFPEFANATPLNCTIEPGDILFMPSFWWHEVQSYPDSRFPRNLAFNFWYKPFLWKEFPCFDCNLDINAIYRHLL